MENDDGSRSYVVKSGDTLCGIAAEVLEDEARWSALFELNAGSAPVGEDGSVLTDPDLIWPGLSLRLPPESSSDVDDGEAHDTTEPFVDAVPAPDDLTDAPEPALPAQEIRVPDTVGPQSAAPIAQPSEAEPPADQLEVRAETPPQAPPKPATAAANDSGGASPELAAPAGGGAAAAFILAL